MLAERLVYASGLNCSAESIAKMNKREIHAFLTFFNDAVVYEAETETDETETDEE